MSAALDLAFSVGSVLVVVGGATLVAWLIQRMAQVDRELQAFADFSLEGDEGLPGRMAP